MKFCWRGSGSS